MVFFVTVLRAICAFIITNSHYNGVYPSDLIANGGLLGDVLFFAISGFCLTNLKYSFPKWYFNRLIRIFPAVWIITGIYLLLHFYNLQTINVLQYFTYPTHYHFVASIVVLYIAYYFVLKMELLANNIPKIMLGLFLIQLIVYIVFYDKSTYHIDTVREPMIRVLFFESMLLGAYFRKHLKNYQNKFSLAAWSLLPIVLFAYFISKMAFVKYESISEFQIINQIILFVLLYLLFRCFAGLDSKFEKMNPRFKKAIGFVSSLTLEIYLVQMPITPRLAHVFPFPLNWLAITVIILVSAVALHFVTEKIVDAVKLGANKIFKNKQTNTIG